MRRECRDRFSRHLIQRKPLVSDAGMHHGTCVTHAPWCMSASLTHGAGKTSSTFSAHAQPVILRIWQEAHALYKFIHDFSRTVEAAIASATLIILKCMIKLAVSTNLCHFPAKHPAGMWIDWGRVHVCAVKIIGVKRTGYLREVHRFC